MIVDLSCLRCKSVNSNIKKGHYEGIPYTYSLPNIMDVADEVAWIGDGAYICVPISPPELT